MSEATEVEVVGVGERRKARAEGVGIYTAQRVVASDTGHIEVVVNNHNVADGVVGVDTAGSIGDDQSLDVKEFENADREGSGLDRMAFVETIGGRISTPSPLRCQRPF